MLIPEGEFRYEIRRNGDLIAVEEESFFANRIRGLRRPAGGSDVFEVEAELSDDGILSRVALHYRRGPFVRNATYESIGDFIRGNLSAMAGRNELTAKLGRYREVDADLIVFRAITIAHVRARGQKRWTGRIVTIDPKTLVATTSKQSCRLSDTDSNVWIYEPRMGDREQIEIDANGLILRRRDSRGVETVLT